MIFIDNELEIEFFVIIRISIWLAIFDHIDHSPPFVPLSKICLKSVTQMSVNTDLVFLLGRFLDICHLRRWTFQKLVVRNSRTFRKWFWDIFVNKRSWMCVWEFFKNSVFDLEQIFEAQRPRENHSGSIHHIREILSLCTE